jgi:hypothetical protein
MKMMEKIAGRLISVVAVLAIAPFTIGGFVATSIFQTYMVVWNTIRGK